MTVGIREVEEKRKRWRAESKMKGEEFLGKHMIPVVLGPKDRHYVIDHHHLARALHDEGVKDVMVTVVKNLSKLEPDSFWFVLDNESWMHPYDDEGRLRPYKDFQCSLPHPSTGTIRTYQGRRKRLQATAASPGRCPFHSDQAESSRRAHREICSSLVESKWARREAIDRGQLAVRMR